MNILDFNDPDPMTRAHFEAPDIDLLDRLPSLFPIPVSAPELTFHMLPQYCVQEGG